MGQTNRLTFTDFEDYKANTWHRYATISGVDLRLNFNGVIRITKDKQVVWQGTDPVEALEALAKFADQV
jgi:hypothetical protein